MEKTMNCPHCKTEISEKDLVCPNCKKVLKLQCPVCGAISKNTICEKCGSVILNKCYKCGKLNSTALNKCPKCGLDINASIGLRESIIEEFAVLTIEISNFDDIQNVFKSEKIVEKFKKNLYSLIKKTAAQKKLRVQFIDNTFIIRFCKDYSFDDSCVSAVDFSIFVAQSVTEINQKLFEAKGITLKTQMAIQKRDIYSAQSAYKSGININVVYSSSGKSQIYNDVEVIADSYVYQSTKLKYPYQSLSAVYIKNQMIMFFELVLHKIIKLEKEEENEQNVMNLPPNIDWEPEEEVNEASLINFKSLNCTFIKAKGENLLNELEKISGKNVTNPIISVKSETKYSFLHFITDEELKNIFPDSRLIRFSCTYKNKYVAYGLFKQMFVSYKNKNELNLVLHPETIEAMTLDKNLQDLLKMEIKTHTHPEDLRYGYFESFTNFVSSINEKTVFVIENIENIDDSSLDILKYLIENKMLGNVGFVFSCDKDFSLHRKIYKLMTSNNYFDIELRPSSNKSIITGYVTKIKDIKDSFFFEKILENMRGSHFYFNQAVEYLLDCRIFKISNGKYEIEQEQMVVIPQDFDELIQKRISHLKNKTGAFELFGSLLILAETVPAAVLYMLNFKDCLKNLQYLEKRNFVKIKNENEIFIPNYNLFRKNFINICSSEELQDISKNLLEKVYSEIKKPDFVMAELFEYSKMKKEAFAQWHSLAIIASKTGDFSAYLNCTNKFLSLVDNVIDSETDKTVDQIKIDVYSELTSIMYKYYPDKIMHFLQMLLNNFEETQNDEKTMETANKLVQCCIMSGNYNNALEYIGKIISRTKRSSFNPHDKNFNINYFLMNLVTLEIYFNLGRLKECIELGEEIFKYINPAEITDEILPEGFSKKQFDDATLDALFFVTLSRIIQLTLDKKEKIQTLTNNFSNKYSCFKVLMLFVDFIECKNIADSMQKVKNEGLNDKYAQVLFPILEGFWALRHNDFESMANHIYNAKIKASEKQMYQFMYFCDLMIGYAYLNLKNTRKAKQIFYNILDISSDKGMKNLGYMSWFLIAKAEYLDNNLPLTNEIIERSILKMEKDANLSDIFILLFKIFSSEINLSSASQVKLEQPLYNCEQAFDISLKKQIYLYLPQIADMLIFVYNKILSGNQASSIQDVYKNKIQQIQLTMREIFHA